jgi:hypothetical protein
VLRHYTTPISAWIQREILELYEALPGQRISADKGVTGNIDDALQLPDRGASVCAVASATHRMSDMIVKEEEARRRAGALPSVSSGESFSLT